MTRKRRFSSDKEKEIFKTGQFISYKTGQIYLLVTSHYHTPSYVGALKRILTDRCPGYCGNREFHGCDL